MLKTTHFAAGFCVDVNVAIKQFHLLQINLSNDDGFGDLKIRISHFDAAKIPVDNYFEICISLEFEFNNPARRD
jgi:hypothetical protein